MREFVYVELDVVKIFTLMYFSMDKVLIAKKLTLTSWFWVHLIIILVLTD